MFESTGTDNNYPDTVNARYKKMPGQLRWHRGSPVLGDADEEDDIG